jgi:hypothetical protein
MRARENVWQQRIGCEVDAFGIFALQVGCRRRQIGDIVEEPTDRPSGSVIHAYLEGAKFYNLAILHNVLHRIGDKADPFVIFHAISLKKRAVFLPGVELTIFESDAEHHLLDSCLRNPQLVTYLVGTQFIRLYQTMYGASTYI